MSIDEVKANFASYGLLDDQVKFLKGWFSETLPTAPIHSLAVARLDGDQYGSTMDALTNLYPKLSIGGYLLLDDFGAARACRDAVDEFRKAHNITDEIHSVDHTGVYWQRNRVSRPSQMRAYSVDEFPRPIRARGLRRASFDGGSQPGAPIASQPLQSEGGVLWEFSLGPGRHEI